MLKSRVLPGAALPPTSPMTDDPVRATQHIFRVLLDALAHPGVAYPLIAHPHLALEPESPHPWLASVALTLVDHEMTLAPVPFPDYEALTAIVQRRTRVELAPVEAADFVVADLASIPPDLPLRMKTGSLDYPDDGATLLLGIGFRGTGDGHAIEFSGPGVDGRLTLPLGMLPPDVIAARNEAVADYPLGIDLFLIDPDGNVIGMPRTTTVVVRENQG